MQGVPILLSASCWQAQHNFSKFCSLVEAAVDIQAAARHEYVLLPHFSPELEQVDGSKEEVRVKIENHYDELRSLFGMDEKGLKLEQAAGFGYVLRVSRKDEQRIRNSKVKGLSMLSTKKEASRTVSPSCALSHALQPSRDACTPTLPTTTLLFSNDTDLTFSTIVCHNPLSPPPHLNPP